jgi:hypothetical protein
MRENLKYTARAADDLVKWYWDHGHRRDRHMLQSDWLLDIYRHRDAATALSRLEKTNRRSLAIWGPSQAGKSTMLSYALDDQTGPGSALVWSQHRPFRFQYDDRYKIDAFNPYNEGSDASGCVSRFRMTDGGVDPEHPITITLMTRVQVMQTVAAGYLVQCNTTVSDREAVYFKADTIREMLDKAPKGEGQVSNREAFEYLLDVVLTVGRLMAGQRNDRFNNLRHKNVWDDQLVRAILGHRGLSSSLEAAHEFGRSLLWDNQPKLNDLFDGIENYRSGIGAKFGTGPIRASQLFASRLVDIDTFKLVAGGGNVPAELSAARKQELLFDTSWGRRGDGVVISKDDAGPERLFKSAKEFGWFQALVWELDVPLSAAFIRHRTPEVAALLEKADVLDIPGVSRGAGSGDLMDVSSAPYKGPTSSSAGDEVRLLTEVFKRGKTVTIINRYAEDMSIFLLSILARAGTPLVNTDQLIGGARAIWSGVEPNYDPDSSPRGRPPVPTVLCLTFMGSIINNMDLKLNRINETNLGTIRDMAKDLGVLADPEVVDIFATTYPQWPNGGKIDSLDMARRRAIVSAMQNQTWFTDLFRGPEQAASLQAVIETPDGGVAYHIGALARRAAAAETPTDRAARRFQSVHSDFSVCLSQAVPLNNRVDNHKVIIDQLIENINSAMGETLNPNGEDEALVISRHLRQLLAFDPEHVFDPVPINPGATPEVATKSWRTYLEQQLQRWGQRTEARAALAALGLPSEDHETLIDALRSSINIKEVADWAVDHLGGIRDIRSAEQARRYVAVKCAEALLTRNGQGQALDPSQMEFHAELAENFRQWTSADRLPIDSPHYVRVIAPFVESLHSIGLRAPPGVWTPQPGDPEIRQLADEWTKWWSAQSAAAHTGGDHGAL